MSTETTQQLTAYYANLLIFQYLGKPKAYATLQATASGFLMPPTSVEQIQFSAAPTSGHFIFSYDSNSSVAIQWNDSAATIQTDLQALPGLSTITVSGSIASQTLTVIFTGVIPPALALLVVSSTLQASGSDVTITVTETDVILPLAVQNAYNLIGSELAQGIQLDILGKYAGVTRTGSGVSGQAITLNDSDFLQLIHMAVIQNNSGSSLATIVQNIFNFFGLSILVFDSTFMFLTYFIPTSTSSDLLQLFITEKLLPKPMGVGLVVIYVPIINAFFGLVSYDFPVQPDFTRPLNTYDDYHTDWPWLSYSDVFIV